MANGASANGVVKRMLSAADWVAGCSQAILIRDGLAPDIISRSSIIHNGVQAPALLPEPPFAPPRLLVWGASPEKGFDLALHALSVVMQEFPEIRLVIAGDGPARLELAGAPARHPPSCGFSWLVGPEMPALINSASMLMPSRQESLPLVALDSADGCPVWQHVLVDSRKWSHMKTGPGGRGRGAWRADAVSICCAARNSPPT
jgi:glycogen(starch) synthase